MRTLKEQVYGDETKSRALLEACRWPNGSICPHCQNQGEKRTFKLVPQSPKPRGVHPGVYFCGACRQQFTVTVGKIMERTHVPLSNC